MRTQKFIKLLLLPLLFIGCNRGPLKTRDQSLRPAAAMPSLSDDLDFNGLIAALDADIRALKDKPNDPLYFGPRQIQRADYAASLEYLLSAAKQDPSGERFRSALRENFDAYEVYGQEDWGQVFITSYFEPILEGSKKPTAQFSQPLYGVPKDLVSIDLNSFKESQPSLQLSRGSSNVLRGRFIPGEKDVIPRVVAYANRAQIDSTGLKDKSKVLAWVDPIDAFFLEIQGSGVVQFKNGKDLSIGYASQNGYPYSPIGKYLFDVIPKEKMTQQSIEAHLRSLPPEEARKIMEQNPSYVFFRPLEHRGITALGTEVVAGRTIATDLTYFPKGALAYLEFEKPIFNTVSDAEPTRWEPTSRFVLDQDTGGAIRGPHRVDLFWGRGPEAKQAAGVMKNKGRLVYFVPKTK
jgi:membrane-bound lytic murein transglycosylase A